MNESESPFVTFIYSTGTGNTAHAVAVLADEMAKEGWRSRQLEFARITDPQEILSPPAQLIVVAAPTLGFSAPSSLLSWLMKLPQGPGTPLAIVAICGGTWGGRGLVPGASGGLRRQIAARVTSKGFRVVSATEHSLPVNWVQVAPPPPPPQQDLVRRAAEAKLRDLGRRLARGEPDRRIRLGSHWWGVSVLFRLIARRFLGKLYSADTRCTGCGWCVKSCPAHAIRLVATVPSWTWNCDGCNRCINGCPEASIQVSWARILLHGVGQGLLTVAGLVLWSTSGAFWGIGAYLLGTAIEIFGAEPLLDWAQRQERWQGLLSQGPTSGWGRYRA